MQERGSLWHFCAALHAFAGYRRRVFAWNFHKATRNADSSRVGQPGICGSTGPSSRLSDFCWLVSSLPNSHLLDWPVLSTGLFCSLSPSLFSETFVLFRSYGRSRTQALCVGFTPKQTKGSSDWHPHTPTQRMPNIMSQAWEEFKIFIFIFPI